MHAALRPCPVPGCPNLTDQPKGCESHRAEHARLAGYDGAWATFAAQYLAAHPTCQRCRQRAAREVHHIRSVRAHPRLRLDPTNVIALCHPCHRELTPTVRADAARSTQRRTR